MFYTVHSRIRLRNITETLGSIDYEFIAIFLQLQTKLSFVTNRTHKTLCAQSRSLTDA